MFGPFETIFQNWLSGPRPRHGNPGERPDLQIVHDPAAQRPHDLDDPFFEAKVQKRVGDLIANAVRERGPVRSREKASLKR